MFKFKISKLKIPKMGKRKKRLLMVSLIALAFVFTIGSQVYRFGEGERLRDISDYSTITYQANILGILYVFDADITLQAQTTDLKITMDFTGSIQPEEIKAVLFGGLLGLYIEAGKGLDKDNNQITDGYVGEHGGFYTWTFNLDACSTGTYDYHIEFYGTKFQEPYMYIYSGDSFTFKVHNLLQVIDPPKITERPADVTINTAESTKLTWRYVYNDESTIRLKQNSAIIDERDGLVSISNQTYQHIFSPTEVGEYIFQFSLDPVRVEHTIISDSVTVIVITVEEDELVDGLPDNLETGKVVIDGTMSGTDWVVHHEWGFKIPIPAAVSLLPLTREVNFMVVTFPVTVFGYMKMLMTDTDGVVEELEFRMEESPARHFLLTIDLAQYEEGEYTCEIRGRSDWKFYKIAEFRIAVKTVPFVGIMIVFGPWILLLGVVSIITLKILREFRGWWGFRGRYTT